VAGGGGGVGGDDATPLSDVTFVVLDLETTGGSPYECAITEVGALKLRGGACLGTFETLVNPGCHLPPDIVYLTGITEAMVAPAPLIDSVLPALAEFIGDAVIVGHNIRFDLAFLRANLVRLGYPPLTNAAVDTCALARRLVRDEVTDCRLATVARHVRTETAPNHRAFADAAATAELLHHFLEVLGPWGVTALDDLLAFPAATAHPQAAKLRLVSALPRRPGVYVVRDARDRVIDVGRTDGLRRTVRSFFAGVDRRRMTPILRQAQAIGHVECETGLEGLVVEQRLLAHHPKPRSSRNAVPRWFVHLRPTALGRATATARPGTADAGDDALNLGPFVERSYALHLAQVLRSAARQAGRGATADDVHDALRSAATSRSAAGADDGRMATAAARSLRASLRMQRRVDELVAAGRLEVELDGVVTTVDRGRLVLSATAAGTAAAAHVGDEVEPSGATARDEADLLVRWLATNAAKLRLRHAEHGFATALRSGAATAGSGKLVA
jgi:DNA polymerase III epsilon subunit family exonuclease